MKKIIIIIILIAIHFTFTQAQKKKSIAKNSLKNIVVYVQKFDSPNEKVIKDSETFFDTKGNTIEEIEYDNGKIKKHLKYEYDSDDKKIKETELNVSGKTVKITDYTYDSNNQKIKETELNATGKIIKIVEYKYNEGLKQEKITKDGNNKIKSKKTYQYQKY
jgi:hypothetical protein